MTCSRRDLAREAKRRTFNEGRAHLDLHGCHVAARLASDWVEMGGEMQRGRSRGEEKRKEREGKRRREQGHVTAERNLCFFFLSLSFLNVVLR